MGKAGAEGKVQPDGIRFQAQVVVKAVGGTVTAVSDSGQPRIEVRAADSATVLLVGASSFVSYRDISADPAGRCAAYLEGLHGVDYNQIKAAHIEDYQKLFRKVSFELGATSLDQPTDRRIANFDPVRDPHLVTLYFQFGRYLMISGSRPGGLPLNLQGIWNDQLNPPWGSKYTCNINLEMNYWPAEAANLAPCHQPLFDLLKVLHQTGASVAKEHYNCRGWVLHHNTDIWGGAAPINHLDHASGRREEPGSQPYLAALPLPPGPGFPSRILSYHEGRGSVFRRFPGGRRKDRVADQHAFQLAGTGRVGCRANHGSPDYQGTDAQLH